MGILLLCGVPRHPSNKVSFDDAALCWNNIRWYFVPVTIRVTFYYNNNTIQKCHFWLVAVQNDAKSFLEWCDFFIIILKVSSRGTAWGFQCFQWNLIEIKVCMRFREMLVFIETTRDAYFDRDLPIMAFLSFNYLCCFNSVLFIIWNKVWYCYDWNKYLSSYWKS